MKIDTRVVGIIGDTHLPYAHPDYLDFCKDIFKKYKVTHHIHIGDEIDGHAWSYHEHNPDGMSAGHELDEAIRQLRPWHKAFPHMDVVIGNHTRLFARKAMTAGLPAKALKGLNEILEVPTWNYGTRFRYDGVLYIHGEGVTARTQALRSGCSVVQGHRHTESYVFHLPTERPTWGMQVGCGVDASSYAMDYAKDGGTPALSVGVVLDNGRLPIVIPMQ